MADLKITAEPGTPFIDTEREFAAPRDLVFRAWTDPELLVRWLGPRNSRMEIKEYDVRDGGRWRYVDRDENGEYEFRGVFHGAPSPDLFIQTFEFSGWPGHVSLETLRLEERDGRTIARTHTVYQSVEDRDGMVSSGMEHGMREGYEKLDALLAELAPAG